MRKPAPEETRRGPRARRGAPGAAGGPARPGGQGSGRPSEWPRSEGGAGRARPAAKTRAGRALPGLLSELNPLPVGRAFPAAPAAAPLALGRCLFGLWREERGRRGVSGPRSLARRGRETRCPPEWRPPRTRPWRKQLYGNNTQ